MPQPWDRQRISDEELREGCKKAIKEGMSRSAFHLRLRANNIACADSRLALMWEECGGRVENRGGWV